MRILGVTAAAAATLIGAIGLAGVANADPTGGSNAAAAVEELRADGYAVQINGSRTDPLSQCVTTAVHGIPTTASFPARPLPFTTVDIDVSCSDDH